MKFKDFLSEKSKKDMYAREVQGGYLPRSAAVDILIDLPGSGPKAVKAFLGKDDPINVAAFGGKKPAEMIHNMVLDFKDVIKGDYIG